MTALRITRAQADEMIAHCMQERPNEACGILAVDGGAVVKVMKMTNASASPVRYSLDSHEQLLAYQTIDAHDWELGGVFHSHTHTEPVPSPTDIRLASEDVPYVIVSLAEKPPTVRAWRIKKTSWAAETGEVEEVPVVISG